MSQKLLAEIISIYLKTTIQSKFYFVYFETNLCKFYQNKRILNF